MIANHHLTARQINEDFSLGQLLVLFGTGYTWAEFGAIADENSAILDAAAAKQAEVRKAANNGGN